MENWVLRSSVIIFLYLLIHFPSYNCLLCNPDDKSALLQFKNSFFFNHSLSFLYYDNPCSSYSSETESWKNITDCCGWDGITCDTKSGHVIGLHLYCSDLRGELLGLNSSIFKLKHLQQLNLTFNDFFGSSIHSSIGNLVNLTHLTLSVFRISGDVPSTISHLSKLQHLYINTHSSLLFYPTSIRIDDYTWNRLIHNATNLREIYLEQVNMYSVGESSLSLLTNLSSSLLSLVLCDTQIQGKLPTDILRLPNLQEIDLSGNENLRGELPNSNWTTPLRFLTLSDTAFSGYLPNSIAYLKSLHTLDLSGCNFEGSIPQSLARCTTLEVLDLGNNNIEDLFPYSLETLPNLQVLSLRSNKFHGIITSSDTKLPFPKLRIFDMSCNYFTGNLPVSYVHNFQGMMNVNDNQTGLKYLDKKILTVFTSIDLSNNMFEGEIPKAIGDLHYLKGLNLSHNKIIGIIPLSLGSLNNLYWLDLSWNQLTGEIPMSLGNLSNLELLDLSWNQLKGEIPMTLTNLKFLCALNLSQNQLEGVIPEVGQFLTFPNDSYAGNLMLCGIPLSNACNEDNKRLPNSTVGEEKSRFGWKPVVIGYVCGMICGIALAYDAFFIRKPQWLRRLVDVVLNVKLIKTNNRNRVTS